MIIVLESSPHIKLKWYAYHLTLELKRRGHNVDNFNVWRFSDILSRLKQQVDPATLRGVDLWTGSWLELNPDLLHTEGWSSNYYDQLWENEWRFGRCVQTVGLRLMLVADSDHDYEMYADNFGWDTLNVDLTPNVISELAHRISMLRDQQTLQSCPPPPAYCGPQHPHVIFVGEKRNTTASNWLPFASHLTERYGRVLRNAAFQCGWTNIGDCPPEFLGTAQWVVACGQKAQSYVQSIHINDGPQQVLSIPHPAWLYRFNTRHTQDMVAVTEETLHLVINNLLSTTDKEPIK
jgi:hypothetical protein